MECSLCHERGTHGALDIVDPSGMQDACQNELSNYDLATSLPVAQWLERSTGARKVMGSIPFGDSDVSFDVSSDVSFVPLVKNLTSTFRITFKIFGITIEYTLYMYFSFCRKKTR